MTDKPKAFWAGSHIYEAGRVSRKLRHKMLRPGTLMTLDGAETWWWIGQKLRHTDEQLVLVPYTADRP